MPFDSPKRKRPDSDEYSSSPIKIPPLITTFSPLPPESQDDGGGGASPRTTVAGKFQRLRLSQWDLDGDSSTDERPSKRPHYSDDEMIMESSQDSTSAQDSIAQQTDDAAAQASDLQQPAAVAAVALSSTLGRAMSTVYPKGDEAPRPRSPSLKGEPSDQFWHESEITGHDPHDPDDDGYGINGIGFKPTSAMAYARLQKRKQQVAEYRSREAKEARQRRSDRRRQGINATRSASPAPLTPDTPRNNRVRFQDGCSIDASG